MALSKWEESVKEKKALREKDQKEAGETGHLEELDLLLLALRIEKGITGQGVKASSKSGVHPQLPVEKQGPLSHNQR